MATGQFEIVEKGAPSGNQALGKVAFFDSDGNPVDLSGGGGGAGDVAWGDVTGKPSAFPPATHNHTIADVSGLQDALDGKQASGSYAPASHTHTVANITGLQAIIDDLTARIETLESE